MHLFICQSDQMGSGRIVVLVTGLNGDATCGVDLSLT